MPASATMLSAMITGRSDFLPDTAEPEAASAAPGGGAGAGIAGSAGGGGAWNAGVAIGGGTGGIATGGNVTCGTWSGGATGGAGGAPIGILPKMRVNSLGPPCWCEAPDGGAIGAAAIGGGGAVGGCQLGAGGAGLAAGGGADH